MKKGQNLHRCFWCVHKIVKKNYWNLHHGFWWAHNIVKKDRNLHHCFWWVHNIAKETLKICITVFDMFTTFWKKKAEICITGFDLFTTLWKKGNLRHCFWCVRCEKRPKILWWFLICWEHCEEKAESCITVFNVFSQF